MSDTHPGDFGDQRNIFGNLANRVYDTHKGSQTSVCQVLSLAMLCGLGRYLNCGSQFERYGSDCVPEKDSTRSREIHRRSTELSSGSARRCALFIDCPHWLSKMMKFPVRRGSFQEAESKCLDIGERYVSRAEGVRSVSWRIPTSI